jgi:hypothetical protein
MYAAADEMRTLLYMKLFFQKCGFHEVKRRTRYNAQPSSSGQSWFVADLYRQFII